jgi:4-hydroxybenzoate polyprenyltransferase
MQINSVVDIMRLKNPTGFLLLFFPCVFGVLMGASELSSMLYIPLFFVGSVLMRGAGCIINDLMDKGIDIKVERTKSRPLASGRISKVDALKLLLVLLVISSSLLLFLPDISNKICISSVVLVALYPLMKRVTYLPQVFLGITFNIGIIVGYSAATHSIDIPIILAYMGCVFWTIGYDTIYGFMDIEDDKKIGVKSMSILLENSNYRGWIGFFYALFIILINIAFLLLVGFNIYVILLSIPPSILLARAVYRLDITSPSICLELFNGNVLVGALWLMPMFIIMYNNIFID